MSFALKGLLAAFWLLLIPTAAGVPFLKKNSSYTIGECFLTGYLFLFAAAEVLTLPLIYLGAPLHILVWCYGAAAAIVALYGLVCFRKRASESMLQIHDSIRSASPFFWCALILIFVQICIVVYFAHFDADDAFYVGTATTAAETDSMFVINPYTGREYQRLPRRYILSPFPIFLAVISQLCQGLHPSIVAHTIFPPVFQIISYLVVYQIGRKWFRNSSSGRGIFLYIAAALNSFMSYSVYNAGSFQMIRIWQGKALLAAALLPMLFYLSLSITMEKEPKYPWSLLLMANTACCLLSSMGIILAPLLQGIFILLDLIRFRSLRRTAKGLLCCLPSLVLGLVYMFAL